MSVTDTQIALLRHAAADAAGEVEIELPQGEAGRAAQAAVLDLISRGYARKAGGDGAATSRIRLAITPEGRAALDPGPADG